jgi:MFS family permease
MATREAGPSRRGLVLAAMIFAVAMTYIDQTIISIAAPKIQAELHLTSTGLQWAINAYLLSLAALFAFGGRLADTVGYRQMVVTGVILFAGASAMCGLTPAGSLAETWIVTFRALQGAGGALMYPAALAIVINTYTVGERGRALAVFFAIAGGLTAVGPALGGLLTIWTWRAIFWVNIPVAVIALILTVVSRPPSTRRPARMDYRGLALVAVGVGLSVFGFQQAAQWGWSNPLTALCVALGIATLAVFVAVESRTESPLIDVTIFADRMFRTDNIVLGLAMTVFVPIFFFASEYAQISLGESASSASVILLYFFSGFAVAAQFGGRMLDRAGARRPIVYGCLLASAGLALWAARTTSLELGRQVWCIVLTGTGMGLMLGQANTDALNRAPGTSYGEVTGITQTVRNYGSSLGLAILGTIMVSVMRSRLTSSLIGQGVPAAQAHQEAARLSQVSVGGGGGGGSGGSTAAIPRFFQVDFADATRTVLYVMAGIMAVAGLVALRGLPRTAPVAEHLPVTTEDSG